MTDKTEKQNDDRKPWDRRDDETDRAWYAFMTYRDAGRERSYSKVAEACDHNSNRHVARWAKRHDWQDRVKAYDNHISRKRIQEAERQHRDRIKDLAEQQRKIHKVAVENAVLALQQTRDLLKKIKTSKDLNFQIQQIPSVMRAAAKVAEASGEMQARSLGIDKLLQNLDYAEGDEGS